MRMRTLTASAVLAAGLALPLSGVAFAQSADRDCADFASQADAQAALAPGDPERLDADDDGQACEDHGYAATASTSGGESEEGDDQVVAKPVGGVEAGSGPVPGESGNPALIGAGVLVAAGAGAVAVRRVARRSS